MSRSTITAARQRLEGLAPALNPVMFRRYSDEIETAERGARTTATTHIAGRLRPAHDRATAGLAEAVAVRDAAVQLATAVQTGQLTAREANTRLIALRNEHRTIASALIPIAKEAEQVELSRPIPLLGPMPPPTSSPPSPIESFPNSASEKGHRCQTTKVVVTRGRIPCPTNRTRSRPSKQRAPLRRVSRRARNDSPTLHR